VWSGGFGAAPVLAAAAMYAWASRSDASRVAFNSASCGIVRVMPVIAASSNPAIMRRRRKCQYQDCQSLRRASELAAERSRASRSAQGGDVRRYAENDDLDGVAAIAEKLLDKLLRSTA
jgi:hypothetical protein